MRGIDGVRSRMAELQAKVDRLNPRPEPSEAAETFGTELAKAESKLSGQIGAGDPNRPVNPFGFELQSDFSETELRRMAAEAAQKESISPKLFGALVEHESGFDPAARSKAGAIGLCQLMPETAKDLNVNPLDPRQNLAGGARYLSQMLRRYDNDVERALAAYNAGPGRVDRANGVPKIAETQDYVRKILGKVGQ